MNTVIEREEDMLALGERRAQSDNPYGEPK
jgi:hypothetical protein